MKERIEEELERLANEPVAEMEPAGPPSGLDELEGEIYHKAYREAGKKSMQFYRRGLMFVKGYNGSTSFALDCWLLAMGEYDILGVETEVELGHLHGVTKANVSKCVKIIQARLGIKPMPGQRTLEACKTFRDVRLGQLEGGGKVTTDGHG